MKATDFLIVGAGIFGITTAIELAKRKHRVTIVNSSIIPDPLAASTDISKVVRMEYGTDQEYMEMAIQCMQEWRSWNDLFRERLYHEVGYLLLTRSPMESNPDSYEYTSYQNLIEKGYKPQRIDSDFIARQYPAINPEYFQDGFYHDKGGYVESGLVLEKLADYARSKGIVVREDCKAEKLIIEQSVCSGILTREGKFLKAGHTIVCAGSFTPYLVPELQPYIRVTGHPVFHLKVSDHSAFTSPNLPVFGADISKTGWYGFPVHNREHVVKMANHSEGLELHPEFDERVVTKTDERNFRTFLREAFPTAVNDPIVYTRRCLYTDTLDGHFWIDRHPGILNLTIGSGGSGHGMKMGPVLGKMISAAAEGRKHEWSDRYRWRHLDKQTLQREEARYLPGRK